VRGFCEGGGISTAQEAQPRETGILCDLFEVRKGERLHTESEERIATIESKLEVLPSMNIGQAVAGVRDYATHALSDLRGLLQAAGQKAKAKLSQHVKRLVLTPTEVDGVWAKPRLWRMGTSARQEV
jgi:hypothetical protein